MPGVATTFSRQSTTILDKIVAKKTKNKNKNKKPPFCKIIPEAPVAMLKHKHLAPSSPNNPIIEGRGWGRNIGLKKALTLLTLKGAFHDLDLKH